MPCLRRFDASVSPWRTGFDPEPVYVSSVVEKVVLRQFFLQTIEIYLVSTNLPIFHTHLHLTTTLIKRSSRRSNVT